MHPQIDPATLNAYIAHVTSQSKSNISMADSGVHSLDNSSKTDLYSYANRVVLGCNAHVVADTETKQRE